MDKRSKELIIIGVCIILAVVGCIYQIREKDRPSLKNIVEVFTDES